MGTGLNRAIQVVNAKSSDTACSASGMQIVTNAATSNAGPTLLVRLGSAPSFAKLRVKTLGTRKGCPIGLSTSNLGVASKPSIAEANVGGNNGRVAGLRANNALSRGAKGVACKSGIKAGTTAVRSIQGVTTRATSSAIRDGGIAIISGRTDNSSGVTIRAISNGAGRCQIHLGDLLQLNGSDGNGSGVAVSKGGNEIAINDNSAKGGRIAVSNGTNAIAVNGNADNRGGIAVDNGSNAVDNLAGAAVATSSFTAGKQTTARRRLGGITSSIDGLSGTTSGASCRLIKRGSGRKGCARSCGISSSGGIGLRIRSSVRPSRIGSVAVSGITGTSSLNSISRVDSSVQSGSRGAIINSLGGLGRGIGRTTDND